MAKVNYWIKKDVELDEICVERGLPFSTKTDGMIRKNVIAALEAWDAAMSGESEEAMVMEGNDVAPKPISQMTSSVDDRAFVKGERTQVVSEEMVEVTFQSKDEKDPPYVPVGLNGKAFYLPKDKKIKIPKVLLNVINDAVEVRPKRVFNEQKQKYETIHREVLRFPYTIH